MALIVTIIVLLILAGISISMLTGDNGIIHKATEAEEKTNKEAAREKLSLILTDIQIDKVVNNESMALSENLANEIASYEEVTSAVFNTNTIDVVIDGYTFAVNGDLGIEDKKEIAKVEPENLDDWEVDYDTYPGYARLVSYKGDATDLVIPNYINGYWVKAVGTNEKIIDNHSTGSLWADSICEPDGIYGRAYNYTITSITISEGIELIEEFAFYCTENLERVMIASTITTIGRYAFAMENYLQDTPTTILANKLTSIFLPKNILTMEYDVFAGRNDTIFYVEYEENEIPEGQYAENYNVIKGWHEDWGPGASPTIIYGAQQ